MKILQVITDTDRRGAQVFATDLGAAMTDLGHEVRTVALAPGKRTMKLDVEVLGSTARGYRTLRVLRRAMGEVDATIAHGSSTLLACGLAGLGPGRPFVYRQISDSKFWAPTLVRRLRVAAYLRLPRRIVALSPSSAATLRSYLWVSKRRVDVVPNGVPRSAFVRPSADQRRIAKAELGLPDAFAVLFIGALVPEKGADIAVRAAASVEGLHLAIAGAGPERDRLQQLSDELAPGRVHFLGDLSDAVSAYHAADVVTLPSLGGDSMPATLIEAGFCGLPAVTTPIGAITDVVRHEETGIIVDPGDVSATAGAFARLMADLSTCHRMGQAAERHCLASFEIAVVAQGWIDALPEANS